MFKCIEIVNFGLNYTYKYAFIYVEIEKCYWKKNPFKKNTVDKIKTMELSHSKNFSLTSGQIDITKK